MANKPRLVMAVVVSFYPDLDLFKRQLQALVRQVARVIVWDNGSEPAVQKTLTALVTEAGGECHLESDNQGLAAAQGKGISKAIALGASHIVLLDQDSVPAADMVMRLLSALNALTAQGEQVAAVGPRLISTRDGRATPFARFYPWRTEKIICNAAGTRVRTDCLVASGLLAPTSVYDSVGLPEAALFIDYVDYEWGFRAQAQGYRLFGVCDAVLTHPIGERTVAVPGLRCSIYVHSPVRQYYQARNRLLLYRRSYCPWAWKVQDFPRAVFRMFYFSLLVSPRWGNARMIAFAVWDALRKISGPCQHE